MIGYVIDVILLGLIVWQWNYTASIEQMVGSIVNYIKVSDDVTSTEIALKSLGFEKVNGEDFSEEIQNKMEGFDDDVQEDD